MYSLFFLSCGIAKVKEETWLTEDLLVGILTGCDVCLWHISKLIPKVMWWDDHGELLMLKKHILKLISTIKVD